MTRSISLALCLVAGLVAFTACGDDGDSGGSPTNEPTTEATEPVEPTTQPGATEPSLETEGGEPPVFWRTADDFESLVTGEAYKVLFRVTNGYAEETITIDAVQQDGPGDLVLTSYLSQPVGEDLPGSYYPTFLQFGSPGTWELTVHAGEDDVTLTVEVAEAPAG